MFFFGIHYNLHLCSGRVCASCQAKIDSSLPGVSDDCVLMCLCLAALSSFQSHLESCQFATVPCPQCQRSVRKSSVELHVTVECQRRPVSCPECFAGFVYEEREVLLSPLQAPSRLLLLLLLHLAFTGHQQGSSLLTTRSYCAFPCQLHQQQCPFASVTCQYCDMDLIRDQVSGKDESKSVL